MNRHLLPLSATISALVLSQSQATLNVFGDYDFAGNSTPAGFTEFGDPTYADGKVTLDGDGDYLQIPSPLGATTNDNFVLEVIANGTSFGAFNFAASISPTTGNGGYGVLAQGGEWRGITNGIAFVGSTIHAPAPTGPVSLAYVMENGNASLYVNGVLSDGGGGDAFNLTDPSVLNIGAHAPDAANGNGFFVGDIDRVRVSTITGTFQPTDLLGPADGSAPLGQPFFSDTGYLLTTDTTAAVSTSLSGSDAEVTLFWADTNYGDNLSDWQTNGNTVTLGLQTEGATITSDSDIVALLEDTRYYYRFYALNTTPDPSLEAWSSPGRFVPTTILTKAVSDLAATAGDDQRITLTWSDAFNTETSYVLERSLDEVTWTPLPAIPENSTTFTDQNLTAETTYSYRILGSQSNGDSGYSNIATATTAATPAFTPTILANYDFEDNATPANFTEFGNPTYANGQLKLDGDGDYLQTPAPATPSDNFVLEAIVTAEAFGSFNFIASVSDASGANSGFGIVAQSGNWNALTSAFGFPGATAHDAAPTPTVALAFVREQGNSLLYVNGIPWDNGTNDVSPFINDAGVLTIGGTPSMLPTVFSTAPSIKSASPPSLAPSTRASSCRNQALTVSPRGSQDLMLAHSPAFLMTPISMGSQTGWKTFTAPIRLRPTKASSRVISTAPLHHSLIPGMPIRLPI